MSSPIEYQDWWVLKLIDILHVRHTSNKHINQKQEEKNSKSHQADGKVYNCKYKFGVRISSYEKKTIPCQPRKSYKIELHVMVLRINM